MLLHCFTVRNHCSKIEAALSQQGLFYTFLYFRRASIRQLEAKGPQIVMLSAGLCSLLNLRPPQTPSTLAVGGSSTLVWQHSLPLGGLGFGFHSWAQALLTHCFCSCVGKLHLLGAPEGLIWAPSSWVGLRFSTLVVVGRERVLGSFPFTWESQRFSLRPGQAWPVTTRRTISTLCLEGHPQVF